PVILLLMDVYPLNRTRLTTSTHAVSYTKLFIEKIPFFMFTVCAIILTLWAQQNAMPSIEQLGIVSRVLNAFNTLFFYIGKFIYPVGLSPFYSLQGTINIVESPAFLVPLIGTLCITILCVYLWFQKKYYWLITWLFYLITLSPVIGIIQVGGQAAADRYVYLPTIPFYMLLGIGFAKLLYTEGIKKYIKYGSIVSIVVISLSLIRLTQEQGKIWKNDLIFWVYAADYTPESALLQYRVGHAYFKHSKYEEALTHYLRAITLAPRMTKWYPSVLKLYIMLNQLDKALVFIKLSVEDNIDLGFTKGELYYIVGWIYHKQGLLDKARQFLLQALTIKPEFKEAQDLLLQINNSKY
ncbi:MAG: tetratricopeptide repeat protein, partial [Thiomargarita sp.]|nr:tetratricopeptide repeat protein [Thiomargarita sp.]